MKEKYVLIAIINCLILEENTTFNFFNWKITNDKKLITQNIPNSENLIKKLGEAHIEEILNKTVAIKLCESNDLPHSLIHKQSLSINGLISLIWLENDNSIGSYSQSIQTIDGINTYANISDSFKTNAKGGFTNFHLKNDFINKIKDDQLMKYCKDLILTAKNKNLNIENKSHRTELENHFTNMSRFQRSFILLSIARSNSFLPMKIAFYVNVLECLLLDVDAELSLRLRLYASTLIGENKEEKEHIMNIVNKAYSVRSQFFHGSVIQLNKEKLENLSCEVDDLTRRIIIKSLTISEIINTKNTNKRSDYFKSILFT
jgi:hypothetical protein